ncbi:MAG: hypothetical protein WC829_04705 [Hyphomicrobium sp.]|jgi:hypothetical protein
MIKAGCRTTAIAGLMALLPTFAVAGAGEGTNLEIERPATPPPEADTGYRPPWANPNAKPPQPGIENDPTPFNPSDVDSNSDALNNNLNNMDQ